MKIETYLPIDLMGGGGVTAWMQISDGLHREGYGYTFKVEWQVLGVTKHDFAWFDTLGAAMCFVALVCDAISAGRVVSDDFRQIETAFAELASRFVKDETK
jgi:hypothetical protein